MIAAQEVKKASAQKDVEPASGDVEQVALAKPVEADTLKIDGKRFNLGMSEGATKVGLQAALAPQARRRSEGLGGIARRHRPRGSHGEGRSQRHTFFRPDQCGAPEDFGSEALYMSK